MDDFKYGELVDALANGSKVSVTIVVHVPSGADKQELNYIGDVLAIAAQSWMDQTRKELQDFTPVISFRTDTQEQS